MTLYIIYIYFYILYIIRIYTYIYTPNIDTFLYFSILFFGLPTGAMAGNRPSPVHQSSIGTLSGLSTGEHRSGVVVGKGRSVDHCLVLLFFVLLGRLLDFGLPIFGFRIGFSIHPAIGVPPCMEIRMVDG